MVRMKDIAGRAGVSVMTVSKVMHDAPDISAKTKERIRQLAAEMGYVPDALAHALRTRSTRLIGLLIPSSSDPFVMRMTAAIEDRLHDLGYDLLLAHTLDHPEREAQAIRRMLARRVDGLLVHPVCRLAPVAPIYEELKQSRVPVVLLEAGAPFCKPICHVCCNDQRASHALTRHLIDLGHRRIAYFAGPSAAPWASARREGYAQALREHGLTFEDDLVFAAGATIEDGKKAALQMLNEGTRPTAIQAVNDLVAIGAATVLIEQGLRVPQDLSLAGFGNLPIGEYFRAPLTTAAIPQQRLGVAAVEALFQILRGGRPAHVELAAEVILRASTARATKAHQGSATVAEL